MTDRFHPVPVVRLASAMLKEYENRGTMLGLPRTLFFTPSSNDNFRSVRYGKTLETPLGVAAGPHTQMTQNIAAAWLCGGRYIELKTVQTLDHIEVTKPCIDAADEGYNCEWSQELPLEQSAEEYRKAWVLLHALRRYFQHPESGVGPGFIFNISVGYNLEGIQKPNVQAFLDAMTQPDEHIHVLCRELEPVFGVDLCDVPNVVSDNITISTMHGCPPHEVEAIAAYFIRERRLHTTIKLNPTLLGPVALRAILNDALGYEVDVPDEAFAHDLKWEDAVGLLARLQELARNCDVAFGVKLTNTLESRNIRHILPTRETMHYMSGRALHPVSLELAHRLAEQFGHQLDISFCAGVDAWNAPQLLLSGLTPLTSCTDLLKPGGYGRLAQVLENVREAFARENFSLPETGRVHGPGGNRAALFARLQQTTARTLADFSCRKEAHPWDVIKGSRDLDWFDCVKAPCVENCATSQKIPRYVGLAAQGCFDDALRVVMEDNPLPHATGMACNHRCQERCTRINYDEPVRIRDIKRFVAQNGHVPEIPQAPLTSRTAAVVGAGPAGLSAAFYLAQAGVQVTLYDGSEHPGGLLERALPLFRLDRNFARRDFERILKQERITWKRAFIHSPHEFNRICQDYDAVFIGVGAPRARRMQIEGEDLAGVVDFLEFLEGVNTKRITSIGRRTVVIGGGNSAIDVARAARRLAGPHDHVGVLYRRTRREMPADREEILELLEEGVELRELVAPLRVVGENGRVKHLECCRMQLSTPDESGRRRPVPEPGSEFLLPVDLVITAIGQDADLSFLEGSAVTRTRLGTIALIPGTHATGHEKVFAGGDVVRGPDSIVAAIADGKTAAFEIVAKIGFSLPQSSLPKVDFPDKLQLLAHRARRMPALPVPHTSLAQQSFEMTTNTYDALTVKQEASRCLACHLFCDVCVSVCPNRANISYETTPRTWHLPPGSHGVVQNFVIEQKMQVANIKDYCNECGNCVTFCPTAGRPFADKPRLALTRETFEAEPETHWLQKNTTHYELYFSTAEGKGVLRAASPCAEGFTFEWQGASGFIRWEDFALIDIDGSYEKIDFAFLAQRAVLLEAFVRGTLIL